MALDKLVDSTQLDSDLTSVANAIRAKSGGSSQLAFPAGFVSEIQAIPSGGGGGTDGLEDVAFNYAGFASGSVENNRLINYTPVYAGGGVWLFLKRTIPLVLNDVIKVTFSNRTYTTASWSDFVFLTPQVTMSLGNANTPLKKTNFLLSNTTEITATLAGFDSAEVYALLLVPRGATNIVAYSADIHVYVNDVLVF